MEPFLPRAEIEAGGAREARLAEVGMRRLSKLLGPTLFLAFFSSCAPATDVEVRGSAWDWEEDPGGALVEIGAEQSQTVGPVLYLRQLTLEPGCSEAAREWSADCVRDEDGWTPWLDTVTRSWNDFTNRIGNAGQDPGAAYVAVLGVGALVAVSDTPVPGPMDAAAVGVVVIGGVWVTVVVGQRLAQDPALRQKIDETFQWAWTSVSIAIESVWASARAGRWWCDASCNLEGNDPSCWSSRASGGSWGSSEDTACREAKRSATQSAPRGCYARHCQCACGRM